MSNQQPPAGSAEPDGRSVSVLEHLLANRRLVVRVAAAVGALTALLGVVQFIRQPIRYTASLEIRPTFEGASAGHYPNGLPFGPSDVTAPPVTDAVYDANKIEEFCSREVFRSAFFTERRSDASTQLQAEFEARLAEPRLTTIERERLLAEYQAKLAAVPVLLRVVFVRTGACEAIPEVVARKVVNDVVTTWATDSEARRGVLRQRTDVLSPQVLDVAGDDIGRLQRADLVRASLWRVVSNVRQVAALPGAELVRGPGTQLSFAEVATKLTDLVRARVEPLVSEAASTMSRDALPWLMETVAAAQRDQRAASLRAEAYQSGLADYSGRTAVSALRSTAGEGRAGDMQTLTPQIDRTFVDRIIEMSESNSEFRQDLTRSFVAAQVEAVTAGERTEYYQRLLTVVRSSPRSSLTPAEIDRRLAAAVEEGKVLTKAFNDLYEEFSRVSLRPAAALFQVEKPVSMVTYREFTLINLGVLVAMATIAASLLTAAWCVMVGWSRAQKR